MRYVPVDKDEAASIVGEGIHTGLRKGTDAENSGDTWRAIAAPESGWSDAIGFFMWGLDYMGMALCKKEPDDMPEPTVEYGLRAPDGIVITVHDVEDDRLTAQEIIAKRVHDAPDYWTGVTRKVAASEWVPLP